ncbi:MAG: S-layer homology domain-containing protein, partial [Anaerovorax sp.]
FMPKDSITRAEFAMILAKAAKADLTKQSQPTFTDVAHQAWYAQAVAWAADNGVVAGVGNQKFAPSAKITRQDMAVMLHRYTEKIMKKPITGTNKAMAFSDSHLIADYAKDSVSKMQQANIISGRGNHVFAPKENASRAEAAKMVTVLLKEAEK